MREIEVKARIENCDTVCELLIKAGYSVSDPVTQHDRVFGLPGIAGDDDNHQPWLRLRTEKKDGNVRYIFTLKKSVTNQLDSIEHETDIADPDELLRIFTHIGYEPYSDVTKTRRKSKIGDIELCIDVVDTLGHFIEAEKLTTEDADYTEVEAELWATLNIVGVTAVDQITDGYDVLMRHVVDSDLNGSVSS
ncbi:hypothetical protein A2707_05805 [Candidatus Saccharibacteria bacterium RIFCSPHIGHO2_01_FULL_45_15]|nr:MAG: hypothetical protein A2707_05805 [Candidatus Saccharibacteria bacterium RIFCSPHIGHO2_01_FULL_45_15]OGL28960.1 MAG: hypothetical protein A3C39_06025 [Candidatus Saccharibacteria bacterium RIFCSPHIGHO2_02_FULL_46_12]OGL31974.1 MAG: hypothetical protein A3E76_01750 [Candidatus Saccharibacteria bacterium RIFCSPHIGHO2_12_FULL_44_22]